MIYTLTVPGPIEDVEEVRVLEWHGAVGRVFSVGELILEFETHKALVEVRAGQPAVLRRLLRVEGEWQSVGQPVALLSDSPDEPLSDTEVELSTLAVEFEVT